MPNRFTQIGPYLSAALGFNASVNVNGTDRDGKAPSPMYGENDGMPNWVVHSLDRGKSFGGAGAILDSPFIIGFGTKIADAYWTNHTDSLYGIDQATDEKLKGIPSYHPEAPTNDTNWIWTIELEGTFAGSGNDGLSGTITHPRIPSPVTVTALTSNQLTTFDTWSRTIPYSKGARRLPGAKLWALGIEGGEILVDTAFGSWAEVFGYPLHPGEEIYANEIIFDGTTVWTLADGWDIPGVDTTGLDAPTFYYGSETQEPDPSIVADKGAANTPAFLGLIYIVFLNVPLSTFSNRRPSLVEVEFLPTDGLPILVADALINVGAIGGKTFVTSGIDDTADGVVFANGMNPRQIVADYAEQYNYQIIDGDPIRLVRRGLNDAFAVDDTIVATDFTDDSEDLVPLTRADPSTLLAKVTITGPDRAINYQSAPQYADFPIFPVAATTSQTNKTITTDFILSAVQRLSIAYDMLYRNRAQGQTGAVTLQSWKAEVEEGDILSVPTSQGQFALEVTKRTALPDQSVELEARYFLSESGAALSADSGDILTEPRLKPYKYPGVLENKASSAGDASVIVSGGNVVSGLTENLDAVVDSSDRIYIASTNIPSLLSARNSPKFDRTVGGAGLSFLAEDTDYYYAIGYATDISGYLEICRLSKATDNATAKFTASSMPTYLRPRAMTVYQGNLYIACSRYDGSNQHDDPKLIRLDLANFADGGLTKYDLTGFTSGSNVTPYPLDMCGVGGYLFVSGVVGLINAVAPNAWLIWRINVADGTLDNVAPTNPVNGCVAAGGKAYFLPWTGSFDFLGSSSFDNSNTIGVVIDPVATFDVGHLTTFDISDDPNVGHVTGWAKPWADATYFYFLTNNDDQSHSGFPYTPPFFNAPYLARRRLSDLSSAGGSDLTFFFDNSEYLLDHGGADANFHYIQGVNVNNTPVEGKGAILKLSIDFTFALFYPPQTTAAAPANDDFPGTALTLDVAKSYNNQYASKETGEPDHAGNVGGHSLWYQFRPAISGLYEVTLNVLTGGQPSGGGILGDLYNLMAVYAGTEFDNLVEVVNSFAEVQGTENAYFTTIRFPAVAGTTYKIATDSAKYGVVLHFSTGTIDVTPVPLLNDNFADAETIAAGQTKTENITFATKESGEPDHAGNTGGHSVWYKFTAANTHTIRFNTTASEIPTLLAVYTGSAVGSLTGVASDSESGGTDDDFTDWNEGFF
jgi:hypothetical protein